MWDLKGGREGEGDDTHTHTQKNTHTFITYGLLQNNVSDLTETNILEMPTSLYLFFKIIFIKIKKN